MSQSNHYQRISQHETWPRLAMKMLDAMSVVFGLFVLVIWRPEFNSKSTIVIALVAIGVFHLCAEFVGLYRSWQGVNLEREICCAILAWAIAFILLAGLGRFSMYSTELSVASLLIWISATLMFAISSRTYYRWFCWWTQSKGINTRSFAVVGINELGIQLVRNVHRAPDLGLKFLGYFDDRPRERTTPLPDDVAGKLGSIQSLVDCAKKGDVQVIYITLPMRAEKRIRSMIQELADTTASVYIVPDLFVFQMLNSRWSDIQGIPVVSVFENPLYGVDGILKRGIDLFFGSLALMVFAIPMLLIAIAIKLTSRGPILFRQLRYGLDGKEILVWKFRSMHTMDNGDEVKQATKDDDRLTVIGGFLRKTSLDELPQIVNVLLGQMSLVGPRPHANAHNEYYRKQIEGYMLRHKVKPGITGLAQVSGCRGETETLDKMEERIKFDHQYIREWSIWLDLKILFRTVGVVFGRENAY